MREDPRCPSCNGKVSATANWCMHCGRDFDSPVDAEASSRGGEVAVAVEERETYDPRSDDAADTAAGTGDGTRTRDEYGFGDRTSGDAGLFGGLAAFLGGTEDRREGFVVGVALLTWLLLGAVPTGFGGGVALAGAAGVGAYLYTRDSAAGTLRGAPYGVGLALIVASVLDAAVRVSTEGLDSVTGIQSVSLPWLVGGVVLLVLGYLLGKRLPGSDRGPNEAPIRY